MELPLASHTLNFTGIVLPALLVHARAIGVDWRQNNASRVRAATRAVANRQRPVDERCEVVVGCAEGTLLRGNRVDTGKDRADGIAGVSSAAAHDRHSVVAYEAGNRHR